MADDQSGHVGPDERDASPGARPERRPGNLRGALRGLERRWDAGVAHEVEVMAHEAARVVPACRRVTAGELRWPVSLVMFGMIVMQVTLPARLTLTGRWLLPAIEGVLCAVLMISNPRRLTRRSPTLRSLGLILIGTASLANGWSAARLNVGLVQGTEGDNPTALLVTGGNIWETNIIIFGLWYWELDRGGPVARARALRTKPDFLFPEMTTPELAGPHWEPLFLDYLYVAYTNATAFSPTDTLPFSRWSKVAMMTQSTISLSTGVLVIARAVNILK